MSHICARHLSVTLGLLARWLDYRPRVPPRPYWDAALTRLPADCYNGPVDLPSVEQLPLALAPVRYRYLGRPVLVAADLRMLRGPVSGTVRLPELLHWSGDENAATFNLDDPRQRPAMYVAVLREAREAAELGQWLNGDWLAELWPRLVLPPPVRAAWEQQHAVLRRAHTSRELRSAS